MKYMILPPEQYRLILATFPDLWERWRFLYNSGLRGYKLAKAAGMNLPK